MVDKTLTPAPRLPPGRRIYAVGDVHGRLEKLKRVHTLVREDLEAHPVARPLLIHLGDLIDRGPESAACVALLAAGPPASGAECMTLMGNHEWMMLDALAGEREAAALWLGNHGAETLRSYGLAANSPPKAWLAAIPARSLAFLRNLPRRHVEHGYAFVHAGVRPGVRMQAQDEEDLIWIREGFLDWQGVMLPEAPGRMIVHGHTPVAAPEVRSNRIAIDTGAGHGGPLTCAALEGDTVRMMQA